MRSFYKRPKCSATQHINACATPMPQPTLSPTESRCVVPPKKSRPVAPKKSQARQHRKNADPESSGTALQPAASTATVLVTPHASPLRERQPQGESGGPSPMAASSNGPSPSALLAAGGPPSKKSKASKPVVFSAAAVAATAAEAKNFFNFVYLRYTC